MIFLRHRLRKWELVDLLQNKNPKTPQSKLLLQNPRLIKLDRGFFYSVPSFPVMSFPIFSEKRILLLSIHL